MDLLFNGRGIFKQNELGARQEIHFSRERPPAIGAGGGNQAGFGG